MIFFIRAAALAVVLAASAGLAHADSVSSGPFAGIPVAVPDAAPASMVVYFSDRAGWKPSDDTIVEAMRKAGSVVLSVDFSRYAKALDADDGECLYVVGDITDLAQKAQRQLNIASYLPPIVVGSGEGATFAYASIADSPPNTLGGAVAIGFENRLGLRLPFCPGAKNSPLPGGGFSYGFDSDLPESAYLLVQADKVAALEDQTGDSEDITLQPLDADPSAQTVDAVQALMDELTPPGELPVTDLPSDGPTTSIALFASGDGGWRDLDKTMGEYLSTKGVHVLGLDSLHYFWSERRPEEFAADISALIKQADPTEKLPVMLIGYSFGADTLPFAWPYLDQGLKKRIRLIGLLALSDTTDFQVSVSGWLGVGEGAHPVAPAVAALPLKRVVCVYGEEEDDGACTDRSVDGATRIKTTGGHHFDGDYEQLGTRLLSEFSTRLAKS